MKITLDISFKALKKLFSRQPEEEDLDDYAIILWNDTIRENPSVKGDHFKEVLYVHDRKRETLPYNKPLIEMLREKRIPIEDLTFGLDKPLERISPNKLTVIQQGVVTVPTKGFKTV